MSDNATSINTWVTAMDNFQTAGGVIVAATANPNNYRSATNTYAVDDAIITAAMPVFFTQLQEAWITAINIDKTGTSGNYSYARKSGKCGQTAQYCLGADGWNITVTAYNNDLGFTPTFINGSGSSYAAPQISGAIALLKEHFPNHSAAQLVDRLLASADNSFLTRDGVVTFGNGVQHGYNDEFGHGMMDIYAALQPITNDMLGLSVYTSNPANGGTLTAAQNYNRTTLISSLSFGDSIKKSFI